MNIFHKTALQGLKKSRTRTLVTIIGVILSAAMITGVASFGISLLGYMIEGSYNKYGRWHAAFLDVPASFMQERARDKEVTAVASFQNIGYAVLEGCSNPDKPYVFIAGYNDNTLKTLPVNMLSGRLPENSSEIVVSGSVAANGGVKLPIGETVSFSVGSRMGAGRKLNQHDPYTYEDETLTSQTEKTYTVVGICQRPRFEEISAPGYTLITKAEETFLEDSFSLLVTLKDPFSSRSYASKAAQGHACIFNEDVLRFMGVSDDDLFNMLLYAVGGIVVIIIMTGSILLIYNAFNISLNERTHQFGILLSVGATERQLRGSVLFEGLCIGAAGIPLGILVGLGSIRLVIAVVARNFENIMYDSVPLTLTISIPVIAAAAVVSLITILISAYIPARRAAAVPVMECIRQTNEIKVSAKNIRTSSFWKRILGLEGMLALKNFKRNKRRSRSIMLSLILSVVLFISANSFVLDLKQLSERAVVFTTYDVGFATQDMDDAEMLPLYDQMKTVTGVYESSYQALLPYACTVDAASLADELKEYMGLHSVGDSARLSMDILFLEDGAYLDIIHELGLHAEEYIGADAKLVACAKAEKNIQRELEPDEFDDMFTTDSMEFSVTPESDGKPQDGQALDVTITFADFIPPDSLPRIKVPESKPYIFTVVAPYSLKETFEASGGVTEIKGITFRTKKPSRTVSEIESIIQGRGTDAEWNLYNVSSMLEENSNMIFIANVFAYTFIILMSMIAAANVFNTISTNIRLRRRELAMLRSVGISERGFQRMMNFECALYGMRALLFGLPLSLAVSWLIYMGLNAGEEVKIDFQLPWPAIGISIFSVLFIVFITMLYSVSRIKKENIIDALRDDMA